VAEVLATLAAVGGALLLAQLLVSRVLGVSLLCHLGLHRWRKGLVGRGRDARYVVKCKGCEAFKDEV
jgi:hypothetical protein